MRLGLLLTLLLLLTAPVTAAYKWIAPDGSVSFADHPQHPDAEQITLPPPQTFSPPPITPHTPSTKPPPKKDAPFYHSITITQPIHDESIRNNAGNISISVSVSPQLQTKQGHQIVITVDGKAITTNTTGRATLLNVDRGTHTIRASIIHHNGTPLISSGASTFHLQRTSVRH
ncbi:MAG: DUF4124 domain-containing protein [Thiotrichaceae bacterium]|nr:DUF4124 domain-containing protein [Thiotrichaceae bacterium]